MSSGIYKCVHGSDQLPCMDCDQDAHVVEQMCKEAHEEVARLKAINAMLGHWYEDAYDLLVKAGIPDDLENPLGDLADDIRSHLLCWFNGEEFKSVRIYRRMEARVAHLEAALRDVIDMQCSCNCYRARDIARAALETKP
jgi:hypothetical protein